MKRHLTTLLGTLLLCQALSAQTINVIGDSYVANHRRPQTEAWHALVAQRHGWTYRNYGRNGSSIAWDRQRFGARIVERYSLMNDTVDVVVVIAGHNDAGLIGNNRDSLQLFRDSLDLLCQSLREKYPLAAIGFVTPWHVKRPGFKPVIKTIHKVCRRHHIPVLDTRRSPIRVEDADFRRQYFQAPDDHAHLNAEGHQLMLSWAEPFFLRLMKQSKK